MKKAKKTPEKHVPHPAVAVSSEYNITVEEGRARIRGTLLIDVLGDGLHAVPLDLGGVGLLSATLDDQPAAIGCAADGQLNVLVSGLGQHHLALDMVAPLEMTAAQQELRFRVTNAAVGKWHLTVPGDVEIKSGADVVSRELDTKAKVTRFELLPRGGDTVDSNVAQQPFAAARAGGRLPVRGVRRSDRGLRAAPCHNDLLDFAPRGRSPQLLRSRRV